LALDCSHSSTRKCSPKWKLKSPVRVSIPYASAFDMDPRLRGDDLKASYSTGSGTAKPNP
jgi:hypothetical protein